ncbi:hypothetical protein [Thermus tengchongensis]|uniref:hypothetical protein n=1 Tax=Thermus tengchongensis TaxID=1214928 RepID=UPI00163A25AA|nr:hypothetical protein [Thermus tengchongensis]
MPKPWEKTLEALVVLALVGLVALFAYGLLRRGLPKAPRSPLAPRLKALRQQAQGLPPERRQRLETLILEAWEALEEGRQEEARERLLRAEAYLELARGEG